jgi:hypothetical protein
MLDQRGQLLRAALGFAGCSMPSYDRALRALRTWLDSWPGVGRVAVGMHCQGYDLQLTATFYMTGNTARPARPAPGGSARLAATQRAAAKAVKTDAVGRRRLS